MPIDRLIELHSAFCREADKLQWFGLFLRIRCPELVQLAKNKQKLVGRAKPSFSAAPTVRVAQLARDSSADIVAHSRRELD